MSLFLFCFIYYFYTQSFYKLIYLHLFKLFYYILFIYFIYPKGLFILIKLNAEISVHKALHWALYHVWFQNIVESYLFIYLFISFILFVYF